MVIFFLGGAHPGPGRQKKLNFEATKLDRYVIPETRRVGHTPLAFLRVIGLATTMMTLGFFVVLPVVSVGVLLKKDPSRKWVSWWKRWREEGSELKIRFHKFKGGCSWKRWWIVFFSWGGGGIPTNPEHAQIRSCSSQKRIPTLFSGHRRSSGPASTSITKM